jgi:hypothetical protein
MCGRIRAVGQIRTIGVVVLLATAAVFGMGATASATELGYTFSGNNQGWQQSQDNGNTVTSAGFQSNGGNPGGRLTAKDTGAEDGYSTGSTPCDLLTFFSPLVPALSDNYGGTASFDLRSSVNPAFAAEVLLLPTGPEYLDGLITETSGTGYHHLSIEMTETANWAVCPYVGGTCNPPTQAQFVSLITASDQVAVIADVGPDGTGETYDLDNVSLTDGGGLPTPPPPTVNPPPLVQKPKPRKCKKKHHRAAAKKGKCKKKKRRAAASALRG